MLPCRSFNYHDAKNCGVGFHGDDERRIVISVRLGCENNLQYQWFYKQLPIGERANIVLEHGDMYVMSEKAVGTDYKTLSKPILRHAAGS